MLNPKDGLRMDWMQFVYFCFMNSDMRLYSMLGFHRASEIEKLML